MESKIQKWGYCSITVCTTLCFGLPEDETCKNYMSCIILVVLCAFVVTAITCNNVSFI